MKGKSVTGLRTWRIVKRIPKTFVREFFAPLWNRDQALALLVAMVGTVIVFQQASHREVVAEINDWGLQLEAFGWALVVWAGFMALRAPFVAVAEEKALGVWHDGRFVYRRPELVATLRCKATGETQVHEVVFEDAEPGSFVYYQIEVENNPPKELYTAVMRSGGRLLLSDTQVGAGPQQGGLRIGRDKEAQLLITMREDMVSQTVRVIMRNFSFGNPEDQDGQPGRPLRTPPKGDDRAQG